MAANALQATGSAVGAVVSGAVGVASSALGSVTGSKTISDFGSSAIGFANGLAESTFNHATNAVKNIGEAVTGSNTVSGLSVSHAPQPVNQAAAPIVSPVGQSVAPAAPAPVATSAHASQAAPAVAPATPIASVQAPAQSSGFSSAPAASFAAPAPVGQSAHQNSSGTPTIGGSGGYNDPAEAQRTANLLITSSIEDSTKASTTAMAELQKSIAAMTKKGGSSTTGR